MVKYSLQKKIFILSLLLMLIPLVLFSGFNIFTSVKKVEENYRSSLIFGMKKIGSLLETTFGDIDQASLFILADPDVKKFLKGQTVGENAYESTIEKGELYNSLNYLKNTNRSIQSIQLAGVHGQILSNGYFPQNITAEDWENVKRLNGQPRWDVDEAGNGKEQYIFQSRLLRNPDNTAETLGLVKIYLSKQTLQKIFVNEEMKYTRYFIVDEKGVVQHTSVSEGEESLPDLEISYEQLYRHQGGTFVVKGEQNKEWYVTPYYLPGNGWMVYSLSEPVGIRQQLGDSLVQLLILAILCFIFCFTIAKIISRRMCHPLEDIAERMKQLEEQQFSVRVEVRGNDEISLLARQFNTMAEKIQSLIEEVYLVNLRRKELELRALQAQVNPHFLYNTLDMIYWTAKVENALETSDMINSLSRFFRQALSGENEFTSVENEIEHLRYYIILRRQGEHPFDFDLEADEDILSCTVVKLVLQPLVENAILHGIQNQENGKIQVEIRSSGGDIIYTITDNGRGIDLLDMNALLVRMEKNNRGFGIKNINDRIQLIYGTKYGIHFENVPEGGAKVTVIQPRKEDRPYDKIDGGR